MPRDIKDCEAFTSDEQVVSGLLVPDEKINKNVLDCLHKLYAEDCIPWLIKITGSNATGEKAVHNAHHAFSDSLLAINVSVKKQKFKPDDKPNSARRFLYFVSLRYFKRLQFKKYPYNLNPDINDSDVYPNTELVYTLEKEEKRRKLQDIIKSMPERCSKILWLKYIDGDITDEIAVKMNLNEDQVHKRLFDCREKLKKLIAGNFNENY